MGVRQQFQRKLLQIKVFGISIYSGYSVKIRIKRIKLLRFYYSRNMMKLSKFDSCFKPLTTRFNVSFAARVPVINALQMTENDVI